MKIKKFVFPFVLLSLFILTVFFAASVCAAAAEDEVARSFKIAHITDPHVFDPSEANEYSADYKKAEASLDLFSRSNDALVAALEKVKAEGADYLIVSGGLTADGGRSSHELVAKTLRAAQTEMRKTNPNFQIFVIPGETDLYNTGARSFLPSDEELAYKTQDEQDALVRRYGSRMALPVNLVDFYEIYHGLGYGEDTLGEINYFFKSSYFYGCGNEHYGTALDPTNPTADEIESQKTDPTSFDKSSRAGGLSYVAKMPSGFTVIAIDSVRLSYVRNSAYDALGDAKRRFGTWECGAAGNISREQLQWINKVLSETEQPSALVATAHHSLVPHSDEEGDLTRSLMVRDHRTASYFLADLGVRYVFTGRIKANDVSTYVSQKGNILYDISSPATGSYGAAARVLRLEIMKSGAEKAFDSLFATESLSGKALSDLIAHLDSRASSILGVFTDRYINEDVIAKLKSRISELTGETVGAYSVRLVTTELLKSLVDDALALDLVKPRFEGGKYYFPKETTAGYNVFSLAADLANYLFEMDCSMGRVDGGYSMKALAKDLFQIHRVGAEGEVLSSNLGAVSEALESGELVDRAISVAMDFILPQLNVIYNAPVSFSEPPAKGTGFDISSYVSRYEATSGTEIGKAAVNLMMANDVSSVRSLLLALKKLSGNNVVKTILANVDPDATAVIFSILAEINEKTDIAAFAKDLLSEKYLSDSFRKDLGSYLKAALLSLATDHSPEGTVLQAKGDVLRYEYKTNELLTFRLASGKEAFEGKYSFFGALSDKDNPPTQADGRLPEMVSVTFGSDPSTQINVKWFTRIQRDLGAYGTSNSYIRYFGDRTTGATNLAEGAKVLLTVPLIDLGAFYLDSIAVEYEMHTSTMYIGNFKDGETVYYRVGSDETGWSELYSFIKPSSSETEILAFADIQGTTESDFIKLKTAAEAALSGREASIIVNAGDGVGAGKNVRQWSWLLDHNADLFAGHVLVNAAGEREKGGTDHLALPGGAAVTEKDGEKNGYYYSFNSGNAHFTVLNTNDLSADGSLSEAQTAWLAEDLKSAESKWKIVVMHKSLYSAGSHSANSESAALRRSLAALFAQNGVSLVLSGHDNAFSVSDYIASDGRATDVFYDKNGNAVTPNGVLYLSLGTLGDNFGDYAYASAALLKDRANEGFLLPSLGEYFTSDMLLELNGAQSFAYVKATADKLSVLTYALKEGETCLIDNISIVREEETAAVPEFSFKLEHDLKIDTLSSSSLKDKKPVSFYAQGDDGIVRYYKGYSVGENTKSKYVLIGNKPYLANSCYIAVAAADSPLGDYSPLDEAELIALVPYHGRTAMRLWLFALVVSLSSTALLVAAGAVFFILKNKRSAAGPLKGDTAEGAECEANDPTDRNDGAASDSAAEPCQESDGSQGDGVVESQGEKPQSEE